MKVVIVAGGKGERLGLQDLPKAMVPVGGVPLLERTLKVATGCGFRDFIFLTGHLSEVVKAHFGDGEHWGAAIDYVREYEPLGTAGCFNQIRQQLTEPFLVVYGDILLDVDFSAFVKFALGVGGVGTLFAHPNDHPFDSDLIEVDTDSRVRAVHPKPHRATSNHPNLVSAAIYVLSPTVFEFVRPEGPSDWGKDVFPKLVQTKQLFAYRSCEYVKDIGTPERLAQAERDLRHGRLERLALRTPKQAIFLDRDGVINEERDGIHSPQDVKLLRGAAQAIKQFNELGIPVICVTNQPDLAKGLMTWEDLRAVTAEIDCQLANEAGAYFDDIFVCPHHPERGWPGEVPELKVDCDCRKPRDGLLRKAAEIHHIDLHASWMIGDRYCDIAAARAAGARSILVSTGHAGVDRHRYSIEPDLRCLDLAAAAELILAETA